jgi:hypothetical protein
MQDAAYFLAKPDQCFRLSRTAGTAELTAELEAMGHEFMAKAVELDTRAINNQKSARPPQWWRPRGELR